MQDRQDERVQAAVASVVTTWQTGDFPAQMAAVLLTATGPSQQWSWSNRMLTRHMSDPRGYRQWQQVGRQVVPGAKARGYILAPRLVKDREDPERRIVVGFLTVPVFDVRDTDGAALPDPTPTVLPPLMDVAAAWGIRVRYAATTGTAYGRYLPDQQEIILHTHAGKTFLHELVHAAEERAGVRLISGQVPDQEIVAEAGAAILATLYGVPFDTDYARRYVAHYASLPPKEAHTAVFRLMGRIEAAIRLILATAG